MAKPIFTITDKSHSSGFMVRLVEFEIPGGVTTPEEFAEAVEEIEKQLVGRLPVFLSGRGPVWGHALLVHAAHATPAVGVYDPRLGYVIIQSHDERFQTGKTFPDF